MASRITLLVMVLFGTVAHAQWSSPTVTQAEYFFGVFDPGEGNASAMVVLDGAWDSAVETIAAEAIDAGTLTAGTNSLFNLRVMGVDGQWGPLFSKTVFVQDDELQNWDAPTITQAEYFFGVFDPGEGSASAMVVLDGAWDSAVETVAAEAIDAGTLTAGTNSLFNLRVMGVDGQWGPLFSKTVFVQDDELQNWDAPTITQAEYFFGVFDPGEGSASAMVVLDGAWDSAVETVAAEAIDAGTLTAGTNSLFNLRVMGVDGQWGPLFSKTVFVQDDELQNWDAPTITQAEYFFGVFDPGEGSASAMVVLDGAWDSAVETVAAEAIDAGTLTAGTNSLFNLRVMGVDGQWGPLFSKTVFVQDDELQNWDAPTITQAEYFFGVFDPGEGNANAMVVLDGAWDSAVETIAAEAIEAGTLTAGISSLFNLRVMGVDGQWGPLFSKTVFVQDDELQNWDAPTITQAEYFFGVFDPGEGNGTPFLAEDGAFDSGVESLLRTSLDWTISAGPILFNVRVKGVDEQWGSLFKKPVWPQGPNPNPSLIPSGPLVICPGETVTIPYEGPNGGNITWFDGSIGNALSFAPSSSDWYSIESTLDGVVFTDSIFVEILTPPTITTDPSGLILVCPATPVFTVTATSSEDNYNWTLDGAPLSTSASITPLAPGTYSVSTTDAETGCTTTAENVVLAVQPSLELICDESLGWIVTPAQVTGLSEGVSITWNDGSEDFSLPIFQAGTYSATLNGPLCSGSAEITVTADDLAAPCSGGCDADSDGDGICDEFEVPGCTDADACNFNPEATDDDVSCTYPAEGYDCDGECLEDMDGDGICDPFEVAGCTDPTACNFNTEATDDDASCAYPDEGYDCDGECLSDLDGDGICDPFEVPGCTDMTACNFNTEATDDDASCAYPDEGYDCDGECLDDTDGDGICDPFEVPGCTDMAACNFNSEATDDDATCTYPDEGYDCDGACLADMDGDGICDPFEVAGCTDPTACNFNPDATDDDASCAYPEEGYDCNGECLSDLDGDGICDTEIPGCLDSMACNYEPQATFDDGSCIYPELGYDCEGECLEDSDGDGICDPFEVLGCTDPEACNYTEEATDDDGSCLYPDFGYDCNGECLEDSDGDGICDPFEVLGCTDPEACNYTEEATDDDGSCFSIETGPITGNQTPMAFTSEVYSVVGSEDHSFEWTISNGAILSGNGTSEIQATWGSPGAAELTVVESNGEGCSGDTLLFQLVVLPPNSVDLVSSPDIQTFPIPARSGVHIALNGQAEPPQQLILLNAIGQRQELSFDVEPNGSLWVSLNSVAAGRYTIEIHYPNGRGIRVPLIVD